MHRIQSILGTLTLLFAGCAPPETMIIVEAPQAELPPGSDEPDGYLTVEGIDGTTTTWPYQAEHGYARVGDLGFGPLETVEELDALRSSGVISLANRWAGGVVPFAFDTDDFDPALSPLAPTLSFDRTACEATATRPTSSEYDTLGEMCEVVDNTLFAMARIQRLSS